MTTNHLSTSRGSCQYLSSNNKHQNVQLAQEKIYSFLLEIVKKKSPEDVLREFKRIFIDSLSSLPSNKSTSEIYPIFLSNNEQEFHNTLKRSCYILINNWESVRKHQPIQDLVEILARYKHEIKSKQLSIYEIWLEKFLHSHDYKELKLFVTRHEEQSKANWSHRYKSYLLIAQSLNKDNPKEQKEAAHKLSKQLKDRFKFDLAMYIARSQSNSSSTNRYRNPTILGDNVLRLIKSIVVKKGVFSYENIANIFLKQTQAQSLKEFKESLQKYLFFSVQHQEFVETLRQHLFEKLSPWKQEYDEKIITKDIILRTCNRVIDFLTTENGREPSTLFVVLLSQGNALTLVIVLLKIILISKYSRSHLELRMAHLIRYYDKYPERDCQWVINFIEIFNITFAIYAENVEYNLIKMKGDKNTSYSQSSLDNYRVFSQLKHKGE